MRGVALFVLASSSASCRAIDLSEFWQPELDLTQPGVVHTFESDFESWDPRRGEAYVMLHAGAAGDRGPKAMRLRVRAAEISAGGEATIVFDHLVEQVSPDSGQYLGMLDVEGRKFTWTVVVLETHVDVANGHLFFVGRGDEFYEHF